jgi:hypothetical protein
MYGYKRHLNLANGEARVACGADLKTLYNYNKQLPRRLSTVGSRSCVLFLASEPMFHVDSGKSWTRLNAKRSPLLWVGILHMLHPAISRLVWATPQTNRWQSKRVDRQAIADKQKTTFVLCVLKIRSRVTSLEVAIFSLLNSRSSPTPCGNRQFPPVAP